MANVIISATSGAAQIVLLPNIIGIQNMAIAFITIAEPSGLLQKKEA